MNRNDQLSVALTERFGLPVSTECQKVDDGFKIIIRPAEVEYTISFHVELLLGWRRVTASFKPGNFASALVQAMNEASAEQKSAFAVFATSLSLKGAKIDLKYDHTPFPATQPEAWPRLWSMIEISMTKIGVLIESESGYNFDEAFPWATGFFGMSLALLPLEPVIEDTQAENEGKQFLALVKRYERSRINRAACIEINGSSCRICGFDFGKNFGDVGQGFIHVHHIIPVSQMGSSYVLNPGSDLIPVCPNCHSMLHRKNPPYTPDEMRDIIRG